MAMHTKTPNNDLNYQNHKTDDKVPLLLQGVKKNAPPPFLGLVTTFLL